ncbi:MAG TPA: M48 family metalloprotease, partial [Kofleriaceae bacterium]|nr:M48 family metalloprotease [Kofleriaceae bacterium]
MAACRQPEATYPPIAVPCNDARIGNVIVEGGGPEDVPQLAVLAGTLDNAARTARVAAASEELLHARGYPGAAVRVARRPGCGVDLVVEVDKGPRYRIGHVSLEASELDVYDDTRLQRYVQRIADRLARGANVERSPRVVIGDHDSTYAAFGERIVIGRMTIERLASEAELAAIVAHELVHIEAGHTALAELPPGDDSDWLAARRDAEAIADERAVVLLERAGYVPTAMSRALAATLDVDDEEHPPRAERLAS